MALELLKYLGNVFIGSSQAEADNPLADYWQYLANEQQRISWPPYAGNGAVIVNGIPLPQTVVEQLRQHGFNPAWCTRYELEAARQEAAIDANVFDDPEGNNFFDELELTEEEREEDNGEIAPLPYRMNLHVQPDAEHAPAHTAIFPALSFCDMEKRRRQEKTAHANDDGGVDMEALGGM